MQGDPTPLSTPVVFLVYRRPDETRRVLEAIAEVAPRRLYVFGDGARSREEQPAVDAVRAIIEEGVDWPCTLEAEFAQSNLGCRSRVVTALDKVFAREPQAIILEDDCLPAPRFFPFCEELLSRYAADRRVMAINGFTPESRSMAESYFFSCHSLPWGWATWRRAWDAYERDLSVLDAALESAWPLTSQGGAGATFLRQCMRDAKAGRIDTWDFQWMFSVWIHGGVVVRPALNMVRNIGFGAGASHTTDALHPLSGTTESAIPWPLVHPRWIVRDYEHDLELPLMLFPWLKSRRRRALAVIRRRLSTLSFRRRA